MNWTLYAAEKLLSKSIEIKIYVILWLCIIMNGSKSFSGKCLHQLSYSKYRQESDSISITWRWICEDLDFKLTILFSFIRVLDWYLFKNLLISTENWLIFWQYLLTISLSYGYRVPFYIFVSYARQIVSY